MATELEHYVSHGAVRADSSRAADARAGALLPRLAMADHVVEVPPPPHRGGFAPGSCAAFYASILVSEILAPYNLHTPRCAPHLRAAAGGASVPRGPVRRSVRLRLQHAAQHGDHEARVTRRTSPRCSRCAFSAAATSTSSGDLFEGRFHLVCPAEGGTLLLLRHRPARARRALAHHLRHAHLAHRRVCSASRSAS